MSARDWGEYGAVAKRLVGASLVVGLPVNSVKLMADRRDHRSNYLWIDPPWEMFKGSTRVVGADDYPDPDDHEYRELHDAWNACVRPLLEGAVLAEAAQFPDGHTDFIFGSGVVLRVGSSGPRQDDTRWYDDWYAKSAGWAATAPDEAHKDDTL